MLSAVKVAARLGIHRSAVAELARAGIINGQKIGISWAFDDQDVELFCQINGVGQRQPKTEEKGTPDGTE